MSIFTTFAKQSMINRLSNPINRNRSAAKISKVMSSTDYSLGAYLMATRKVLGNYLWETTWGLMMKNAIVTPLPYGVCKNLTSTKEYYI